MKASFLHTTLCLLALSMLCRASELEPALKSFAAYDFGHAKKVLHDTRMTAFRGTGDEAVRKENERLLLVFIESDATVVARRKACLWLSDLGSAASQPALTRLLANEGFADVAQIALDALREKAPVSISPLVPVVVQEDVSMLEKLSREGQGESRLRAIRKLGMLGRETDTVYFLALFDDADAAVANAASDALRAMPQAAVSEALLEYLKSDNPALQAKAIQLVALRGDTFSAGALWSIAEQESHPNRKAAIRALGKTAPPSSYGRALEAFVRSEGASVQKDWQLTVWDLTRRQPDYDQALATLKSTQANVPAGIAATLASIGSKLETIKTGESPNEITPAPPAAKKRSPPTYLNTLLPGSYSDIVPKRFEVAGYLNCGPGTKMEKNGVSIECLNGKPFNSGPTTDPSLSVLFSTSTLDFNLSGLESGQDYVLGMTWWDVNFNERWQSIWINGEEVLPTARAMVFDEHQKKKSSLGRPTPTRIQFALQPEQFQNGSCKISIKGIQGPNVVASELWVAKRVKPKADKQVLLISGQDFPGHHWRKTGPVLEKIIHEDARMEVTICETPYVLGLKHLDAYDLIVAHFKNYNDSMPSTQAMQENLKNFVMDGGGMCMSHFACGAFMEWPEFVNLSGRIWSRGGHDPRGPFTVNVVDQQHPITRGLGAEFQTDDELYWCLTGDPDIHLLCDAVSTVKKVTQPQALVFEPGNGRTFLCTLGHDVKAYDTDEVRRLYRQGAAWAAGLE